MNEKSVASKRSQMSTPFGMAQTQKLSYSQISHLNPDDVLFFKSIDIKNEDIDDTDDLFRMSMLDTISGTTNDQNTTPTTTSFKTKSNTSYDNNASTKTATTAEETCDLPSCRQVKIKIKDIYLINHAEREKIHDKIDKIKATMKSLEKKHNHTINKSNIGKNEYNTSLNKLNDLDMEIRMYENIKSDLYKGKSEIENKIMVLEADHQYLLRAIADTQKAISTAIFSSKQRDEDEVNMDMNDEHNNPLLPESSSSSVYNNSNYSNNNTLSRHGSTTTNNSSSSSHMIITHHTMNRLASTANATDTNRVETNKNTPAAATSTTPKSDLANKYKHRSEQINFPFMSSYTPLASLSVVDSTECTSNSSRNIHSHNNSSNNNSSSSSSSKHRNSFHHHYYSNNNSSNIHNQDMNGLYIDNEDPLSWKSVFSANNSSFYKSVHNPKNLPHVLNYSTTNTHYSIADTMNDDGMYNNNLNKSINGSYFSHTNSMNNNSMSITKSATMSSLVIPPPYTMPRRTDVSSRYRTPSLRYISTTPTLTHHHSKIKKHSAHSTSATGGGVNGDSGGHNDMSSDSSDDEEESAADKLKRELSAGYNSNTQTDALLNPIYYHEKAGNLFARQRPIGKLKKIKKNPNNFNDDDDDDDFAITVAKTGTNTTNASTNMTTNMNDDNKQLEYRIISNNKNKTAPKHTTSHNNNNTNNSNNSRTNTSSSSSSASMKYKKKHFAKLLTFNHPGISEYVLQKHHITANYHNYNNDDGDD